MKALDYLINELKEENPKFNENLILDNLTEKRKLFRILLNVRPLSPVTDLFIEWQDTELKQQLQEKGVVTLEEIPQIKHHSKLKLWQGDITRLKVDAIVNAANSQMLGCFHPLHGCIDNAIHSAAGIQLRLECNELMKLQGFEEPTGCAKITKGYNLPAEHVIHSVGPIIRTEKPSVFEEQQLVNCYLSCLQLANQHQLKSIAFCCISTGEFRFPNQRAAEIATHTVLNYFNENKTTSIETVVFNVFKDVDFEIYNNLLQTI
jgi:O-acetyl-ADP-ribose deacetylase (regulator of RNase III)